MALTACFAFKVEKTPGARRPGLVELWRRFPKFVLVRVTALREAGRRPIAVFAGGRIGGRLTEQPSWHTAGGAPGSRLPAHS